MLLSKGVLKWFKLSRDPFTGELKSGKDVFSPHSCTIVELRIWKAVDEQQMAALVGDVGSGKSTIMAKVLEEMGRNKLYRIVHVYSLGRRKLTASQLCDALIADLLLVAAPRRAQTAESWIVDSRAAIAAARDRP